MIPSEIDASHFDSSKVNENSYSPVSSSSRMNPKYNKVSQAHIGYINYKSVIL